MQLPSRSLGLLTLAFLAACAQGETGYADARAGSPTLPMTTTSDVARTHFEQGQRAMDLANGPVAHEHFLQAVAADPDFALAHLRAANTAPSLEGYTTHLAHAEALADSASQSEQLLIKMDRAGFQNDWATGLSYAKQLAEISPGSPRALTNLAGWQASVKDYAGERASLEQALGVAPAFLPAVIDLSNSYLFNDPKDFARGAEYARRAVEIEPDEPYAHDMLGDALRRQGDLAGARDAYTRAAALDPTNGNYLQQRGHVNSFLGDFDAARADYDAAIALGKRNQRAAFAQWRAFVPLYAGNPDAAIAELRQLAAAIDTMGVEEPRGLKIGTEAQILWIAGHTGKWQVYDESLARITALFNARMEQVGTDDFRRQEQSNIAFWEGLRAAYHGDVQGAKASADRIGELLAPMDNPRKMEGAHMLLGLAELEAGNHAEALTHLDQANPNFIYVTYLKARAHEGLGHAADAQALYREVAEYNFNNAAAALTRNEARSKLQ
ncbi:MAG: tetratricopeptide repeat protein [Gemmatimonadota bacterium]|nr:tetratricopeptide repeat protein [Gemmatimonadota bacterium]